MGGSVRALTFPLIELWGDSRIYRIRCSRNQQRLPQMQSTRQQDVIFPRGWSGWLRGLFPRRDESPLAARSWQRTNVLLLAASALRSGLGMIADRVFLLRERLRGRKFYICHSDHEHDRIYAENLCEYFDGVGLRCQVLQFDAPGERPELRQCLGEDAIAVIGFNAQLDHCCFGAENFVDVAAQRNIPVIHWILDHPSSRWDFINPTSPAARFLLVSGYCERYFRRHALPQARSAATLGVGPNRRSRITGFSHASFLDRDINCLIALNTKRIGGTREDLEARIARLDPPTASAVNDAIERVRYDLDGPLDAHLELCLAQRGVELPDSIFHPCAQIVEEMTQIWRRLKIFEVAARFPVRIQTDIPPPELVKGAVATFINDPQSNSVPSTMALMKSCRAVLSISLTNDMLHDRTANGLNAGCASIVEHNIIHRRLFKHGRNGLMFRYDDESLADCLDLVCNHPDGAYEIARSGFELRDHRAVRFNGFHNILRLAKR